MPLRVSDTIRLALCLPIRNEKERDCWFSPDAKSFNVKIKRSSAEILFRNQFFFSKFSLEPKTGDG